MSRRFLLWGLALAITLGAFVWQRFTGPTYPARPSFTFAGVPHRAKLNRKGITGDPAPVAVPAPAGAEAAVLRWRRYPTNDAWTETPLNRAEDDEFLGSLPSQPPAGKVEYEIVLSGESERVVVPGGGETVVLRFKASVPLFVLLPHILMMALSILLGVRAGLAALLSPGEVRPLALLTLGGMTLGGLILGPIAQKYAFGEYWTGFPFGYDLTDNKLLLLWLVWAAAVAILGFRPGRRTGRRRYAVALATVLMLVVYLIPHSLRGSELDYDKLREGVSPKEAIKTG